MCLTAEKKTTNSANNFLTYEGFGAYVIDVFNWTEDQDSVLTIFNHTHTESLAEIMIDFTKITFTKCNRSSCKNIFV